MTVLRMKNIIKNNIIAVSGFILGMAGGFLYWKYVGCLSGTCPLTSNPWIMLAYGGITGGFLGNTVQDMLRKSRLKKADSK